MSKESHNWSDSEFWELNQGKEASFTWTHQFLFWFKHPIWTLSWNSLCMCVILSKTMSWRRLEVMVIMEKWEIDAESQNYVSVLSRLALARGTRSGELVSKTCIFATVTTSSGELLLALASSAGSATHVFASVTHSQPR
jgi:hypothetical protein